MRLYAIRHGESEANAYHDYSIKDPVLTNLGLSQAHATAEAMPDIIDGGVCVMYSSPYRRALQTASEINRTTDIPIQIMVGLHEFNHVGSPDAPLLNRRDIEILFPEVDYIPPEINKDGWIAETGELGESFSGRVIVALKHFQAISEDVDSIIMVSHGYFIFEMLKLADDEVFRSHGPSNCSIAIFDISKDVFDIIAEPSVDHLPSYMKKK